MELAIRARQQPPSTETGRVTTPSKQPSDSQAQVLDIMGHGRIASGPTARRGLKRPNVLSCGSDEPEEEIDEGDFGLFVMF